MKGSRTGTRQWMQLRRHLIAQAKAANTPCLYCGQAIDYTSHGQPNSAEVDHLHPVALGGHNTSINNLTIACRTCNRRKSNKPVAQLFREAGQTMPPNFPQGIHADNTPVGEEPPLIGITIR